MSKKSRKRNKKILGALAAGLGAMALAKRGVGSKGGQEGDIGLGLRPPRVDDYNYIAKKATPKKKVWTGNQTMGGGDMFYTPKYKHGGSVTGVAKRGFGRALMKGKK